jgi:regulatory protein
LKPEVSEQLPGTISSITVQKRDKKRYSIFVEEEFLIGVSEETLAAFSLAKGQTLTPSMYHDLQRSEGRHEVKSYCLKMLGRRSHARSELVSKALKKGFVREVVEDVLDELGRKKYLDDRQFAREYASDKARLSRWGPRKIYSALRRKGVDTQTIEQAIDEQFEAMDVEATLVQLVTKRKDKFAREKDPYKRKKKIFNYLRQKGFESASILNVIDRLLHAIER